MPAICTKMEFGKRYSIEYKGLKNSTFDYQFVVDNALFEYYESQEIRGGNCDVEVTMTKSDRQLDLDFVISGEVTCECDRCLEDCQIPIDYEGHLIVRLSEQQGEYDGEVMWLNPAENELDLTQYIYESIVLSLPYQRVHPAGECNPDMLARFSFAKSEDIEALERKSHKQENHGIDEGDFNKLAALKAQMERGE